MLIWIAVLEKLLDRMVLGAVSLFFGMAVTVLRWVKRP